MVGDAMGAILWVIPLSVSQAPMARAPTLPPITYGAVLAGTGTWRLIHVRHEVDKVVRVGVVVGVGLRVVLRVHVHLRRVAIGHRSDVSRTAWKRAMLAPLPTQILRSTRDPWNIPVRIILVHEQDEIDLKRMRSDVMSESPHKTPPRERSMWAHMHAAPAPYPWRQKRILMRPGSQTRGHMALAAAISLCSAASPLGRGDTHLRV
jgi:hypothetical protein